MANPLKPCDRFTICPSVRTRTLDDELILLDLRQGEYFSLNATGAEVWHALESGKDVASIEKEVTDRWPVPASEARTLLENILAQLVERGLVEPVR